MIEKLFEIVICRKHKNSSEQYFRREQLRLELEILGIAKDLLHKQVDLDFLRLLDIQLCK